MMWQIVLSLVCVAFLGAILWEKRQGKLMQSASDRKLENVNCLFDAILTHIHAYVLVIDSDFKVLKTNYYDLTHFSPDGKEKRVGDLLQCRNALSAKGDAEPMLLPGMSGEGSNRKRFPPEERIY